MPATRSPGEPTSREGLNRRLQAEGLSPRWWSNGPGDSYAAHEHDYHKVLFCFEGSITFHVPGQGDVQLAPGDQLDLTPGTQHAATVGPHGVECVEAAR